MQKKELKTMEKYTEEIERIFSMDIDVDVPEIYGAKRDIKNLIKDLWQQAYRQGERQTARDILDLLEEKPSDAGWSRSFNERLVKTIKTTYLSDDDAKSFFDLSEQEKREIVTKAAEDSNRMQKEFMDKHASDDTEGNV